MSNQKKQKQKTSFDITTFRFRKDTLLVRAIRETTASGLVNPEQYDDKPEYGEVVKIGTEVQDLQVGNIVRFGKYSTEQIRSNGEDYFIVHEEDIHAVEE